jgi:Flp pilus assembly protein TadG
MLTIMRHERNQPLSGQTLVLFALMSLLLLAGLGLIFDAGLDYSNRRTMQNAADTAALRGARVIAQKAFYAPSMLAYVKTEVENTAVANGVPSAANVICEFIDDDLDTTPCTDGAVPSGVTGVKVRVSETHAPLVMKVLGITTTGTAATAAAQVQMVDTMHGLDFPFMVCGVDTATVANDGTRGSFSILTTDVETDPGPPEPSPSPMDYTVVADPYDIDPAAYSYDWNVRNGDGTFYDYGGPKFVVYGNGIESCGLANWKGLVERSDTDFITLYTGDIAEYDFLPLNKVEGSAGSTDDVSPHRSINGPQGCKASAQPSGCVMLLPIGANNPWCPTQCLYTSEAEREEFSTNLLLRRWGVFYVTYDSASGEYWGRLIKNYPMHTDGVVGWDPSRYVGPLKITIIKAP